MSVLDEVLRDLYVEPEVLEELTKDQRELLFELIREEQIRRWKKREHEDLIALETISKSQAQIKWASTTVIWEDAQSDKAASEAAKRLAKLEKKREAQQMQEDKEEAKILAKIELENEIMRRTAEAERRAEELRLKEAEEKARVEQEETERRAAMEREQYLSLKEARLAAEREEKERKEREKAARELEEQRRAYCLHAAAIFLSLNSWNPGGKEIGARTKQAASKQKEIYQSMRDIREQAKKLREEEERRMDALFKEQQERARKADEEKRKAVQIARQLARERASTDSRVMSSFKERSLPPPPTDNGQPPDLPPKPPTDQRTRLPTLNKRPAPPRPLPPTPTLSPNISVSPGNPEMRPDRPADDESIIEWFKQQEFPKGVGRDPVGRWCPWFHGIISRSDAEGLLKDQPQGAFLIRVSTRIWGYTLSFVDKDRFKHFLVDASEGEYKVFGAQTSRSHSDLATLIAFHQSRPVSKSGTKLSVPVGSARGNISALSLVS
eukprot:gene2605-5512_t